MDITQRPELGKLGADAVSLGALADDAGQKWTYAMPAFVYREAKDPTDLLECATLRTKIYLEESRIAPSQLGNLGGAADEHDERSTHYLVYSPNDSPAPIGTFRITEGPRSQVAKHFSVGPFGESGVAISGVALQQRFRSSAAAIGMYKIAYDRATNRGYPYVYMEVDAPLLSSLRLLGLPIEVLNSPRLIHSTESYSVRTDVASTVESLRAAAVKRDGFMTVADFFASTFDGALHRRALFGTQTYGY